MFKKLWRALFVREKTYAEEIFDEIKKENFDTVETLLVNNALAAIYNQLAEKLPEIEFNLSNKNCIDPIMGILGVGKTNINVNSGLLSEYATARISNFDVFETNVYAQLIKAKAQELGLAAKFNVTQSSYPARAHIFKSTAYSDELFDPTSIFLHLKQS